jgi:hypothetical protein
MPLLNTPPAVDSFIQMELDFLLNRFAFGVQHFDKRVVELKPDQLDMAFLPDAPGEVGRWPCRVLLGHLADAEVAFAFRMRRVVGEDNPLLEPWDENAFIDNGLYGTPETPADRRPNIGAFVATIFTLRKWTHEWLRSLPAGAWTRKGLHKERGEQTLKTIVAYDTWHLEHHAVLLNRKVARFLGPG